MTLNHHHFDVTRAYRVSLPHVGNTIKSFLLRAGLLVATFVGVAFLFALWRSITTPPHYQMTELFTLLNLAGLAAILYSQRVMDAVIMELRNKADMSSEEKIVDLSAKLVLEIMKTDEGGTLDLGTWMVVKDDAKQALVLKVLRKIDAEVQESRRVMTGASR